MFNAFKNIAILFAVMFCMMILIYFVQVFIS